MACGALGAFFHQTGGGSHGAQPPATSFERWVFAALGQVRTREGFMACGAVRMELRIHEQGMAIAALCSNGAIHGHSQGGGGGREQRGRVSYTYTF